MVNTPVYNKFNRGEIDDLALARDDVTRVNNSASLMENFFPLRLGPMRYRPGFENLDVVTGEAYLVEFIAATDDTAIVEFTNNAIRLWINDVLLTRTAVTSSITNPDFDADIASWNDTSGGSSVASWNSGGYASLLGDKSTSATLDQTIGSTQTGVEHTLNITILRAPLLLKIGTSGSDSDEIFTGTLLPGVHSLVFTPSSNITITMSNSLEYECLIDSIDFSAAVTQSFATNITAAKLSSIRYYQSADVIFITHDNGKIIQIERRGVKSWSVVDFRADDGPFKSINTSDISMVPAALKGDTTLTASKAYFKSTHVGALFKVGSIGQQVTASVTAQDNGTNSIKVTGVETSRIFNILITGLTATGSTVTLQRSSDDAAWFDVESYTSDQSKTFDDNLDNSILFYRLHVKTGDYAAGTILLTLDYAGGSIEGVCRVTEFTSSIVVNVQVLKDFGSIIANRDWFEGQWSDLEGYPTSNRLYEGRLWFAGQNNMWGSVSDAFSSFDRDIEGDSKSIFKTVGFGPVESIYWLADSSRLIMGLASDEISVRSSSFGEVLTQNNINLKPGSSQGAAPTSPLRIDESIYFSQRSKVKLIKAEYASGSDSHKAIDLMTLNQDICSAGIKRMAVSRQPETRIFIVLDDGSMRVYLMDEAESVAAWSRLTIKDGLAEDVVTLPGLGEDRVYVVVNRSGTRYLEKMADVGDYIEFHTDSFKAYTSPGTTITGLSHLNGSSVNVWADNQDRGEFTVSSGEITVPTSWTDVTVGLKYNADYISNKLGQYADYSVLTKRVRVVGLGMLVSDLWPDAITYGPDLDSLNDMPDVEDGADVDKTALINEYDHQPFEFDGEHSTNSRVAIRATGPCTIKALVYEVKDSVSKATKKS
jgi:hypothetical protein